MTAYGWALSVGGTLYQIKTNSFTRQVDSLDSAVVRVAVKQTINAAASIVFNNQVVMAGYVKSCNQVGPKTYSVLLAEQALELKTQLARTSTGSVEVAVNNPGGTMTIHDYVIAILGTGATYGSGYTDGTGSTSTTIPGTANPLPSMKFTSMYRLAALDKFLKNTCGYMYWFDYTTKTVYYGEFRTDRTSSSLDAIEVREMANSAITEYTEVVIYGKNTTIKGFATTGSPPYKTIQYQYMDYADETELTRIAEQILIDKSPQGLRYEVDVTIQKAISASLAPGDKVTVTWPLESISDVGIIRDIKYKESGVTLGIGDREVSAFDLLDEKLRLIEGMTSVGSQMVFSGGWQNISATVPTDWLIEIEDVTKIGDFNLKLAIDKWKTAQQIDEGNADVGVGVGYASVIAGTGNAAVTIAKGYVNVTIGTGHAASSAGTGTANTVVGNNQTMGSVTCDIQSYYSLVSVSATTWEELGGYSGAAYIANGRHFGLVDFTTNVRAGTSECLWYIGFFDGNGTSLLANAIPVRIPVKVGAYDTVHTIHVSALMPFNATSDAASRTVVVSARKVDSGQPTLTQESYSIAVMQIGRHDHVASDSGHSNHAITDAGHSDHSDSDPDGHTQTGSDTGHSNHSTNDNGHSNHPGWDDGHEHDVIDEITLGTSYPSNVNIYIYNSTYPAGELIKSDAGGSKKTIDAGDIAAYLVDGDNWISVESDTIGSGWLSGTFTSYGDAS